MQSEILGRQELTSIPSASGIEIMEGAIFIIGDNSPFLFQLDSNYSLKEKIQIASVTDAANGIIPKSIKPDYEAMASAKLENDNVLFVFGSGSKSHGRDSLLIVHLVSKKVEHYSLTGFYKEIKSRANLTPEDLNIEAAAIHDNTLYLFNRGKNTIIECPLNAFMNHLLKKGESPALKSYRVILPVADNRQAGFSGATISNDKIVFTASVENTTNWIDDGEITGSYVGIIKPDELKDNYSPACIPIKEKGKVLKIKAESVAVVSHVNNTLDLLLVTDSDGGASELIKMRLTSF